MGRCVSADLSMRKYDFLIQVEQLLAAMRMEEKANVQCGRLSEVLVDMLVIAGTVLRTQEL